VNIRHLIPTFLLALFLTACGGNAGPESTNGHVDNGRHSETGHDEHSDERDKAPAQTTIEAAIAQASGIRVAPAGPGVIADEHEMQGLLTPVESRVAQVAARYPGLIRRLSAGIGDRVRAGQVLATIESNLSLADYTVTSPIAGVVLARDATLGAVAGEGAALFVIADLSSLWVDLHVFGSDAQHITADVPVTVTRLSDGVTTRTRLERVLPGTATASQSTVARATIANDDGLWRPGSAVRARIAVDSNEVALAVPLGALQTGEGNRDVVYVREGDRYEERSVTLGRRDARHVEVTNGLRAGEQVVVEQSFLVKADIGKSAATHEH
jgi:cobalt-zinc-cadmium efflux system membrane fusion protein